MLKKPWLVLLVFQTSDLFFTANQTALFGGKRQVFAFYHTMILHMHVHGIYINILSHHDFAYARTRYIHKHFCLWWFNQGKKYENSNTLKRNYRTVVGVALSVCSDHLMPFKDSHLMQRTFFFSFWPIIPTSSSHQQPGQARILSHYTIYPANKPWLFTGLNLRCIHKLQGLSESQHQIVGKACNCKLLQEGQGEQVQTLKIRRKDKCTTTTVLALVSHPHNGYHPLYM